MNNHFSTFFKMKTMDFSDNLAMKSENKYIKSEYFFGEPLELDSMVKTEVEPDFQLNFSTDEKLQFKENQWNPTENFNCAFIDRKIAVENNSQDGSYRTLQEFCQDECKICHEVFKNRYHLIQHYSTHLKILVVSQRMYQCDYCSVYFTEKNMLADHIYSIHNEKNKVAKLNKQMYYCSICQKSYKYKYRGEHITSVHGGEKFECSMCKVTFKCLRYLKTHNYYRHGRGYKPGGVKCNLCPKTFKDHVCLRNHVKNCHSFSVQCEICHIKVKSTVYLRAHMRRAHYNDGKIHKCDICSKEFKCPRYVQRHMKKTHAKMADAYRRSIVRMSCECGDSYVSVRKLESHLKVCQIALKI